ncbi:MAG: PAS domain-containing protein [Ramlibacter sp.]
MSGTDMAGHAAPARRGEMAARIAGLDAAATPFGPADRWPPALRFVLELMLPAQAQMVVFWGPDLITFYNDAYVPSMGGKHPAALGQPVRAVWPELWDEVGPLLHSVLATGETVAARDRMFRINRQGFPEQSWFDISYSPIRAPDGSVDGILAIVSETTDRVLAARALATSEARVREASERIELALNAGAVIGTWVWNIPDDRFTGDERFARTFALDPAGLRNGLRLHEVKQSIHPDDIERVNGLIAAAMQAGGPYRAEYRVLRDDGGWRWIEANGRVERDAQGNAVRFPGVLIDIDRRRATEATLRRSEARFRALAEAMPNHVWTAGPDGRLDWLNQRTLDYAGMDADTLRGDGWAAIVHPDDLARVGALWARAIATGEPYEAEFRIRRHDGAWRWHLVRAAGTDGEADVPGQRWIGTNTDIHDQKTAQDALAGVNALLEQRVEERTRDLRETEARLHQSQKMEALGQLTGGIAHDFNNLLQGITGAMEVLRRRVRLGQVAEADRYAEAAIQSAHRAAALVQRLLAFARRQALDPQAVDTNALVRSMEDLLRRTLGENVQLQIRPDVHAWPARCDPNQLESAILNLAINARDAMPHGGRLQIASGNASLQAQQLQDQETLPAGDYATLTVSDTGAGMDARVLARVFEPFFTTKPVGQGTGLGLPMIYGFARQSGGGVRLESAPGLGTTVTLYLPRHAQPAPALVEEAIQVERGGGEVVLVVEDEPSVRLLVIDALHELGYRTIEAAHGDAALRFLDGDGRIDLLVSDVGLPGINGRQLAEQARGRRPGLPVLLMTGYAADAADRSDFLPQGVHLLTKPFAMAALGQKVKGLMGGQAA